MTTLKTFLAGLGFAAACTAASAGTLVFSPSSIVVDPGASFSWSVRGEGFAETIVGGGFNLSFDASFLQLSSVAIAPIWEFAPAGGTINNVAGTLTNATFNSFVTPRTGSFDVAVLSFTAGFREEAISLLPLAPSSLFVFSDVSGTLVTPTFGTGTVTTAIPEPSTVALLLVSVAGMAARLRNRRGQ